MASGTILRDSPHANNSSSGILGASSTDGVATVQMLMLDALAATDPGYWMPWAPFHKGSIQVTGLTTGTLKLIASNNADQPFNTQQITVGGSATPGDILTVQINCDSFQNGFALARYTVVGGDTLDTIAAGLAAAIEAQLKSQAETLAYGGDVNLASSMMVIIYPATTATIDIQYNFPLAPLEVYTAISDGGTETLSVAAFDDGSGFEVGSDITANGLTAFDICATWIKVSCTALSTGTPTAIIQGNIP